MPFIPRDWRDLPDETTPLNAAALVNMEVRLSSYTDQGDAALDARVTAVEGSLGSGGGLPPGGTAGQTIKKNSSTDGDASWADTATLSNATPKRAGVAAPGTSVGASRDDHIHQLEPFATKCPLGPVGQGTTNGLFTWPFGRQGTVTNLNEVSWYPIYFEKVATIRFCVQLTTAGAAGAVVRFGIYDDDFDAWAPNTLIGDLGSAAADGATGFLYSTSFTVQPGLRYWMAHVVQSPGTAPALSGMEAPQRLSVPSPSFVNPFQLVGRSKSGVTGALPASVSAADKTGTRSADRAGFGVQVL